MVRPVLQGFPEAHLWSVGTTGERSEAVRLDTLDEGQTRLLACTPASPSMPGIFFRIAPRHLAAVQALPSIHQPWPYFCCNKPSASARAKVAHQGGRALPILRAFFGNTQRNLPPMQRPGTRPRQRPEPRPRGRAARAGLPSWRQRQCGSAQQLRRNHCREHRAARELLTGALCWRRPSSWTTSCRTRAPFLSGSAPRCTPFRVWYESGSRALS